jgi:hypothetical protein
MSLLDHPEVQALLADAVRGRQDRLAAFLRRYLPCFYRAEQRANAALVIRGLLSGLQRKTGEPIAVEAGVHPVPLGFGRVYVQLEGELDADAWLSGLNAGRSFVTTGPMLFVTRRATASSRPTPVSATIFSPQPWRAPRPSTGSR